MTVYIYPPCSPNHVLGAKPTAEVLMHVRWWGCLVGQYNAMGPEVRFFIYYNYTEHCF